MNVRALTSDDIDAAARSLGDAFADDPVFGWLGGFADDAQRMTRFARWSIESRLRTEQPLMTTTDDHAANALWDAPDHLNMTLPAALRAAPTMARTFRSGIPRALRAMRTLEDVHPGDPHYYLWMVGVRRGRQGEGLGSAVLAPVLERCDAEGLPAYLENSKPANEAFYARHGFVSLATIRFADDAPPLTPMWREPR